MRRDYIEHDGDNSMLHMCKLCIDTEKLTENICFGR
jgi:hypothetical protein